jgi:YcaO-like protein with predicted kinase domain
LHHGAAGCASRGFIVLFGKQESRASAMMLKDIDAGHKRDPHRTHSALATLKRLEAEKHRFGITRIAMVTGLDRVGIPVALATRPNSRSVAVSQGKGLTVAAAKVSALIEAIELWHAENIVRAMVFAAHRDLPGDPAAIDVERLPRVADSRYSPHLRMLWIEGHDLMSGRNLLVPYEMVHADYRHPMPPGHGCFASSTNGLASGGHLLEAICYAVCEVIERDAISIWYQRGAEFRTRSRIEPSTIDGEAARTLWAALDGAGLDVAVWDATSDVEVAAFHCLISDRPPWQGHIGLGSGAHPDRREALTRALSEAAQTRLNYITGARDDLSFEEFRPRGRQAKARAATALFELGPPSRDFSTVPTRVAPTFRDDLDWLLQRLASVAVHQVVVVDLTRNASDVSVVRVVIPGLEAPHDDDHYVPGPRANAARAP